MRARHRCPERAHLAEHRPEKQARERGASELYDDVARDASPWEVPACGETEGHCGIEMGARNRTHEQDDRHHHQRRSDHCRRPADSSVADRAHNSAAGADDHEQECADCFGKQPLPLESRVVELSRLGQLELEE